jgi:hypothetical protein
LLKLIDLRGVFLGGLAVAGWEGGAGSELVYGGVNGVLGEVLAGEYVLEVIRVFVSDACFSRCDLSVEVVAGR